MSCLIPNIYYSSFALNQVYNKSELMVVYLIQYLNYQYLYCSNALLVQGDLYLNNILLIHSCKMDCLVLPLNNTPNMLLLLLICLTLLKHLLYAYKNL